MMKFLSKTYEWLKYSHTKRRDVKFWFHRLQHGWDDSETWSLDYSLAKLILPRLRRFKELANWKPSDLTWEEWQAALDQMIAAFEYAGSEERWNDVAGKGQDLHQEGLELFSKYYFRLWW